MAPKRKKVAGKENKLQPARAQKVKFKQNNPKKKLSKRKANEKAGTRDHKSRKKANFTVKFKIKSYKDIDSNKYASRAQRAAVAAACAISDDTSTNVCICRTECDSDCQNRQLYM